MLSEDLKTKIDEVISKNQGKKVWEVYEETKKVIYDSYDYLEGIKYILKRIET